MTLELRHYDTPLLRFEAETDAGEPNVRIVWVNEERRALLPLGMEGSDAGLFKWLRSRTVPNDKR